MTLSPCRCRRPLLAALLVFLFTSLAWAEVSPATTVVVINGAHPDSAPVARRWMTLRKIPEDHAVVLDGIALDPHIELEDFQKKILAPIEAALVQRGLAATTLLVAYGPGFPTRVVFNNVKQRPGTFGPGSLTGMTFLAPVLADGPGAITKADSNSYAEVPVIPGQAQNTNAMRDARFEQIEKLLSDKKYPEAEPLLIALAKDIPAPVVLYNLACVQAIDGRVPQALGALSRAVDAGWLDERLATADPDLTILREEPLWPLLLKRMRSQLDRVEPGTSEPFVQIPARNGSSPGRLAIMLGVNHPRLDLRFVAPSARGQTAAEAISCLERSVAADGTQPKGTVWLMRSEDGSRTSPREWAFIAAARALQNAGVAAKVFDRDLPPKGAKVVGATLGVAQFDWRANGATMLPGAWCDHFASFGGYFYQISGQTPLTAFLDAGAAGSGGAVEEPLTLAYKFPSAFVHLHRVRGLSLVEAVYRSLSSPYQYLVVGDPLSRPWTVKAPAP